jgi:hypothetical protein
MKYLLLLAGDESGWENVSDEDAAAEMAAYEKYDKEVVAAGVFVAGEGLQPSSTATTMRILDGERVLTDGPFAETKELDEALDWAERCPASAHGLIEIRPVLDYEAMGYDAPQDSQEVPR